MSKRICILFDTDMDTDCDDVGAFAMLLEAHRAGEAELIGVVADSVSPHAAPCCEVITQYYGISVPIGAVCPDQYPRTGADGERFAAYRRHSEACLAAGISYNERFAKETCKTDKDYPSAVTVYRKQLAAAEDRSVTVLCVGMLTAVAEALASPPDDISPLSGVELFEKKVDRVITMGNPDVTGDFNWGMDAVAAESFFRLCPVPIYVSAEGTDVLTGDHLSRALPAEHPLRRAYEIWLGGEDRARSSWDLIAALYAIRPNTPYLRCDAPIGGRYDCAEKKFFADASLSNITQIRRSSDPTVMARLLNRYMLGDLD